MKEILAKLNSMPLVLKLVVFPFVFLISNKVKMGDSLKDINLYMKERSEK